MIQYKLRDDKIKLEKGQNSSKKTLIKTNKKHRKTKKIQKSTEF